jgi:hypothetical protein
MPYATLPSIGNRVLGMLNDHVVSFCSWPSFCRFRGQNVSPRMQRVLRRQTTTQEKQPQRRALLDRRNGPREMKIPPWRGSEVDLQTLPLCKPQCGQWEPYLLDLATIFRRFKAIFWPIPEGADAVTNPRAPSASVMRHWSAPWWWTRHDLNLHLRVRARASSVFPYTTGLNRRAPPLQSLRPQLGARLARPRSIRTVSEAERCSSPSPQSIRPR